jgi:hypothetical protein
MILLELLVLDGEVAVALLPLLVALGLGIGAGERDPLKLASLRFPGCKSSEDSTCKIVFLNFVTFV